MPRTHMHAFRPLSPTASCMLPQMRAPSRLSPQSANLTTSVCPAHLPCHQRPLTPTLPAPMHPYPVANLTGQCPCHAHVPSRAPRLRLPFQWPQHPRPGLAPVCFHACTPHLPPCGTRLRVCSYCSSSHACAPACLMSCPCPFAHAHYAADPSRAHPPCRHPMYGPPWYCLVAHTLTF